ncbi:MAG TPA: hypothetical protein VGL34_13965 [Steroidobacteraceae bacterium]|jgi:hypothetical protein
MSSDVTPAADIAIMGAILLAGLGVTPERGGVGIEMTAAHAGAAGLDVAEVFRWVFVAGLVFAVIAMAAIILMEERPLHGPRRQGNAAGGAGRGAGGVGARASLTVA